MSSKNILIEMPKEQQDRITSKAFMAWAESSQDRAGFIAMYEKLSAEKYFVIERAKTAQAELMQEMEIMREKIIKLQTP